MNKKLVNIGTHGQVEILDRKDVNGRFMVKCNVCKTYAHAYSEEQAVEDLRGCSCSPNCLNCENLRKSGVTSPAVPVGGACNDKVHVCPNDGNRWWQANGHFHSWQQVTNDQEWETIKRCAKLK